MINGANYIIEKLNNAGFFAYMVGGCVRDTLMGISPYDYDITTNAKTSDIVSLFEKTFLTGEKHGTVTVIYNSYSYEVTTFRIDGKYINNRKPESVTFTNELKEDIKRRDFTINSIAYNEKEGYIDYFNGVKDIENKIIRTVLDPYERFKEDALRILRGIRFSVKYSFSIEEETLKAMKKLMPLIKNISGERLFDELSKTFKNNPYISSLLLYELGFFDVLEFKINKDNIEYLKNLNEFDFECTYAVLTYNKKNYDELLLKLKPSNEIKTTIKKIRNSLNYPLKSKEDIKLLMYELNCENIFDKIINVRYALKFSDCGLKKIFKEIKDKKECFSLKDLKVNGNDLLTLGIKGEKIKTTLNFLLREVIKDNSLNTKEKLFKILNKI